MNHFCHTAGSDQGNDMRPNNGPIEGQPSYGGGSQLPSGSHVGGRAGGFPRETGFERRKGGITVNKRFWACLLLTAILALAGAACAREEGDAWQQQYDLGVKYLGQESYQEAVVAFEAAIAIDPNRPEAFIGRGDAYALSGDLPSALEDYETAIALDETVVEVYSKLADIYLHQGDVESAQTILQVGYDRTGETILMDRLHSLQIGRREEEKDSIIEQYLSMSRDGTLNGELVEADILIFINRLVPEYEAAFQEADISGNLSIDPFGVSIENAVSLIDGTAITVLEASLDWRARESILTAAELFSPEETPENWREVRGAYVEIPLHAIFVLTKDETFQEINDGMFYPNGPYRLCVVWCDKVQ